MATKREILEDRYDGLIVFLDLDGEVHDERMELQTDLSGSLSSLVSEVARVHPDEIGTIVDELHQMIREHVIGRLLERDLAEAA